jgi:hypothetical protein
MTYPAGVELEEANALQDAADYLYERGMEIKIYVNTEANITRDIYGSTKKRTPTYITLHAYPVDYSPTDDQLMKAGIREQVDIIATVATKHLTDNGLSYSSFDTGRFEVEIDGDVYSIKDKNQKNHFSHVYLNVVLGLSKK